MERVRLSSRPGQPGLSRGPQPRECKVVARKKVRCTGVSECVLRVLILFCAPVMLFRGVDKGFVDGR